MCKCNGRNCDVARYQWHCVADAIVWPGRPMIYLQKRTSAGQGRRIGARPFLKHMGFISHTYLSGSLSKGVRMSDADKNDTAGSGGIRANRRTIIKGVIASGAVGAAGYLAYNRYGGGLGRAKGSV